MLQATSTTGIQSHNYHEIRICILLWKNVSDKARKRKISITLKTVTDLSYV